MTPDSFSDGGNFLQSELALQHALKLISEGADIIDIGGESTRPGAHFVSVQEEISRVVPVISALRSHNPDISISIDTSKPEVMQAALNAGADFINDVNALKAEDAVEVAAQSGVKVCLMHKQGTPETMQINPQYNDVISDIIRFFEERLHDCLKAGIPSQNIILDPGIGFGKTLEHNLTLLANLDALKSLGFPLLIGVSRKSMIGQVLNADVDNRLYGSLAIAQYAYMQGAQYFRVHDVKQTSDVLKMTQALVDARH